MCGVAAGAHLWFLSISFAIYFLTLSLHHHLGDYAAQSDLSVLDTEAYPLRKAELLFAKIDSPNHPYCSLLMKRHPIVKGKDGDMDIAFTLVVHKQVRQIARLLRMIYRENNYYCIHPDAKSDVVFVRALKGLVRCFGSNVYVVPRKERVAVTWGDETVLFPQKICAISALQNQPNWKYLLNIVGQEFPLRTNLELVAALKALNGSNLVEGQNPRGFIRRTGGKQLPLKAKWYKGTLYGAFTRGFIEEVFVGAGVAPIRDILFARKAIKHPDEFFFNTLAYNAHLGLPGACKMAPQPENETNFDFLAKYVIWGDYKHVHCTTKTVRNVCILGNPQVAQLKKAPHFFANKFHADYHPEAYADLEQWYFDRVRQEQLRGGVVNPKFDTRIYSLRSCSKDHVV